MMIVQMISLKVLFCQCACFLLPVGPLVECEKRDPILAIVANRWGQCDDELIDVTNKNTLSKFHKEMSTGGMFSDAEGDQCLNRKMVLRLLGTRCLCKT